MKKVAIVYDFDKTLCGKDMQEYSLIPSLGYANASDFWAEVTKTSKQNKMDSISAYLYLLQKKFQEQNHPLRKENFSNLGKQIELYPGVETWFNRINEYGKKHNLEVEHYVISSGMSEILEDSEIAHNFRKIYACKYFYDEEGIAKWPAVIVNYTTKTQYIFRINKQVLDENNDKDLNTWVPFKERPIPFSRMVYIADGITDVPCLRLVKEYGGKSIAVYNPKEETPTSTAIQLLHEGRVNYISRADYRENNDLEILLQHILDEFGAQVALEELKKYG